MNFDWLKTRQTKYGAYSATYIIVVLACLAAANYLADRYNKSFDATKNQLYSLSDQTLKILGDLDRDLKIYYFDQGPRFPEAQINLVRYQNASNRVTVDYVDPDAKPALAQAIDEFHHDEKPAVVIDEVDHVDHVRAARRDLLLQVALGAELLPHRFVDHVGLGDLLDRDRALEQRVVRPPDDPLST